MKKYLQANRAYLLDYDTFKFVPKYDCIKPYDISVPFYIWDYWEKDVKRVRTGFARVNGKIRNTISKCSRVFHVKLNDLTIHFAEGYKAACIKFTDAKTGRPSSIAITAKPRVLTHSDLISFTHMVGVDYKFSVDCGPDKIVYSKLGSCIWSSPNFRQVEYLGYDMNEAIGSERFSYGIRQTPYEVRHNMEKFYPAKYVMLCGTWAILLDDDLRFETLVALNGVTSTMLDVSSFLYTTNRRIAKMMILGA